MTQITSGEGQHFDNSTKYPAGILTGDADRLMVTISAWSEIFNNLTAKFEITLSSIG
jgi:hypothetical protein